MPRPPERAVVAQRGVRPHAIVVLAPALDDNLRFAKGREDLAVQQLGIMEQVHHLGGW